ncbi:tetratricopeptide repeat protein [Streptomyces sp. NPDC052676]|uniref:tetratricopeptide repeat protein n=1 Tax=Streptomyces sp. NPDC052676 TaxID=3154953 RepID=UPI003423DB72
MPEVLHKEGTVNRADGSANRRYLMRVDEQAQPCFDENGDEVSPWAGLSGAAVFCRDLLIGVVFRDFGGFAHTRLELVPAYVLLADGNVRRILTAHGVGSVLEPAEYQQLRGLSSKTRTPLPLEDRPAEPALFTSPAALLAAEHAVVPFHGQDRLHLLEDLRRWSQRPGAGVRLVHGPGGQGKTRLALELTERLTRAAEQEGVGRPGAKGGQDPDRTCPAVVWLDHTATENSVAELGKVAVPLLVVIDYAETCVRQLTELAQVMADHRGATPFRVLLLARTDGDWWSAARATCGTRDLLADVPADLLHPLQPEPADRPTAYGAAVRAFARALTRVRGQQHHNWPQIAEELANVPESRLRTSGMESALTLHMTALADLLDKAEHPSEGAVVQPAATDATEQTAEKRLLDHESTYWKQAAQEQKLDVANGMKTLHDALAAAFLCGADDHYQAEELLGRIRYLQGHGRGYHRAVADWIAALYPPGERGAWGSLRPDRLAEYFVGLRLTEYSDLPKDLLTGDLTEAQATQLLTVHARAAAHPAHRETLDGPLTELCLSRPDVLGLLAIDVATQVERPQPLVKALEQLAQEPDATPEELLSLADRLPRPTHTLAPLAADVTKRLVTLCRNRPGDDRKNRADLAVMLRRLTARLTDLGSAEEAHVAAAEAVNLYGELAAEDPLQYRPELAVSLHNLASALGDLGRRQEALSLASESVRIFKELAEADKERFLPDLSRSLKLLAHAEGEAGHPHDALTAMEEAVTNERCLVKQRGEEFRPRLAAALNDYAIWLQECGERVEAVEVSRESVALHRELAEQRPDAYRSALAVSLGMHSKCLGLTGQGQAALEAIREAVAIREDLATERREIYRADLALSLNSLAIRLDEMGRCKEALKHAARAVGMYRDLVRDSPTAFRHHLATALNTYANQLHDAGLVRKALKTARESVGIFRPLYAAEPDTFTADLAMSLITLSGQLQATGQHAEALRAIEESLQLYGTLTGQRPGGFRHDLAKGLNNRSLLLRDMGRLEEALTSVDDAIGICQDLVRTEPAGQAPVHLAMAVFNKATCLAAMGRDEQAVLVARDCVSLYRGLRADGTGAHERRFASALTLLWSLLQGAGRTAEALEVLGESVEVREHLMSRGLSAHDPQYANELRVFGMQLAIAGRMEDAVEALRKSVAAYRRLGEKVPERHVSSFAVTLAVQGTYLMQLGRRRQALPVVKEAVALLSDLTGQDESYQPVLAESLSTLGLLLSITGRQEAHEILARAVALADSLPAAEGHDVLRSSARTFLGNHLAEQGRTEQGLSLLAESVNIARDLVATNPAHSHLLATALSFHGWYLAPDPRRQAEALEAFGEAVSICEQLVEHSGAAGQLLLVHVLPHHGLRLAEAGRYEEALDTTARAVDLSQDLITRKVAGDKFHRPLALYAYARSRLLADVDPEGARKAIKQALPLWQDYAANEPGLVRSQLDDVMDTYARLVTTHPDAQ